MDPESTEPSKRPAPSPAEQVGGDARSLLVEEDLGFVERAPRRAKASVEVGATPAQVWAVLIDHRAWPEWFGSSLVSCKPTSESETGVGSTRVVTLRGGARIAERFIAWDEPELWAFTATAAKPRVFRSLVERVEIAETAGGSRVTYTMAFDPAPALKLVAPLLAKGISRSLKGGLEALGRRAAALPG